jgi:hypothetical protein
MIVKEFLALWADNPSIKIMQMPIKKIDKISDPVHRQTALVSELLESNQNYLDFEIAYFLMDDDLLIVVCKAKEEQARKTVDAYLEGR